VTALIHSVSGSTTRQVMTDADGNFAIRDLPPGMYEIGAYKEGLAASDATVEVGANKTANANVQLTQWLSGSRAASRLLRTGFRSRASEPPFTAWPALSTAIWARMVTGLLIARDLPPGTYQVVATKPGFSNAALMIVEVVKNRTAIASVPLADAKAIPIAGAAPQQRAPLASAHAPYAQPTVNRTTAPVPPAARAVDTQNAFCFRGFHVAERQSGD
jgi:hypothetical protein